jgi:DNA-directed RNA polymerase specialized sigma24 family protein
VRRVSAAVLWRRAATKALAPIPCDQALVQALGHDGLVRTMAERLAGDDPDLADDLLQEGMIQLWAVDPTRIDRMDEGGRRFLRRVMVNHMRNVAKEHRRRR